MLSGEVLIPIYKAFVRLHLNYDDVHFDQAFNASSHEKLESIQYNSCFALTGTIKGTPKEKIYLELGLELLRLRLWYRNLCLFYKIFKNIYPLFNLMPVRNTHYSHRNSDNIPRFNTEHDFFKNYFFPSTITKWNNVDIGLWKCEIFSIFKK